MKTIADRVRTILVDQLGIENLTDGQQLDSDLGMDSLDAVELVMAIEEDCAIEISESDTKSIEQWTVGQLIAYVEKRVAAAEASARGAQGC